MKQIIQYILICFMLLASGPVFCQGVAKRYPVIGEQLPGFTLPEVHHFSENSVSSEQFRGKWLILDLWTSACTSCIESFPKMNELQGKFRDDFQFMLVGKTDHGLSRNIRQLYERVRTIKKLDLAIAYDSALFEQFGVEATPYIVIADPTGIVRAITSATDITEENLSWLRAGKIPYFEQKYSTFERDPDDSANSDSIFYEVLAGVPKGTYLYTSVLTRWSRGMMISICGTFDKNENPPGVYRATCMSLARLYKLAYTGNATWGYGDSLYNVFYEKPVLELQDPSLFAEDFEKAKGLYNYRLVVPAEKSGKKSMMRALRYDLLKYFGYEVKIETRKVPCLKLTAAPGARKKLASKGKPPLPNDGIMEFDHTWLSLDNVRIDELISRLYSYHYKELWVDETGFMNDKIDITFKALLTDLNDVERGLKEQGLLLVRGYRKMNVLVIRDPGRASLLSNP